MIDNGPAARTKFAQNIQKGWFFLLVKPGTTSLQEHANFKIQSSASVNCKSFSHSLNNLFVIFLAGHDMGDPFEISTVRREVFDKLY